MDSIKLRAIIIVVLALFAALYLGFIAATAQVETAMWVVGGSGLLICILLGQRIWMILPFLFTLNLTFSIPGQPSTILVAQAVFVGFALLLFLLRKLPYKPAFTELGFWTLLFSICILQTYLRNPVGLNILGSDSLGARPYGLFFASLVSAVFLANLKIPAPDLKWILRLSIIGGFLNFVILSIGTLVPRVGMWVGAVSPIASDSGIQQTGVYGVERATRIFFVRDIARNLSLWISSFKSPLRACFHPIWAPLVILSAAFAAMSGYRNEIAAIGLTYLVAIYYHGGKLSVFISIIGLAAAVIVLALINLAAPLPTNVQRSLSFLPGTWDRAQIEDAEDSTEWRVEMWKEALLTDIWIENKLLGDGLGMSRREYDYTLSLKDKQIGGAVGSGKLTLQQELMMASGSYHSGPVSAIRATGYVGLLVLLVAQIRLAVHAHRQIRRARGTEWFPLTLLIGIPLVWSPIFFVFVFGTFLTSATHLLMGSAMVRVLENNLPLPAFELHRARRNQPLATRGQQVVSH